jgi:large subunit ribosomal protein L25
MSLAFIAERRNIFGKNASRRIRREGKIPAILYGEGIENVPLVLNKKDLFAIMKTETRENTIFKIQYDSESQNVMIKEIQKNPATDELFHVDLVQILMDRAIRVSIPLQLTGEAVGVKTEGGFVDFVTRQMDIECLPVNIPEYIPVDISGLHLHQSLKVGDLAPPEGVKFLIEPGTVIVLIQVPHAEEVEVKPAEEAVAEEVKEPEVIKKERAEKEEEEK